MKKINFQKQHSLNYSHIFYNEKEIKHFRTYRQNLQNKLDLIGTIITRSYFKLLMFILDYMKQKKTLPEHKYELSLLENIYTEYLEMRKNGNQMLNSLSNQLEQKGISLDTYKLLEEIIDYQLETTEEIVSKKLSLDRAETVYRHLREVPYYLQTDLELESLPTIEKSIIKKELKSKDWEIIEISYNLDKQYSA